MIDANLVIGQDFPTKTNISAFVCITQRDWARNVISGWILTFSPVFQSIDMLIHSIEIITSVVTEATILETASYWYPVIANSHTNHTHKNILPTLPSPPRKGSVVQNSFTNEGNQDYFHFYIPGTISSTVLWRPSQGFHSLARNEERNLSTPNLVPVSHLQLASSLGI